MADIVWAGGHATHRHIQSRPSQRGPVGQLAEWLGRERTFLQLLAFTPLTSPPRALTVPFEATHTLPLIV